MWWKEAKCYTVLMYTMHVAILTTQQDQLHPSTQCRTSIFFTWVPRSTSHTSPAQTPTAIHCVAGVAAPMPGWADCLLARPRQGGR